MFVKLHPYRMNTIRARRYQKLSPKYCGPFKIVSRVGQVAYQLSLPNDSSIHPIFHVLKLKKHKGDNSEPGPLPSTLQVTMEPEHVLRSQHSLSLSRTHTHSTLSLSLSLSFSVRTNTLPPCFLYLVLARLVCRLFLGN